MTGSVLESDTQTKPPQFGPEIRHQPELDGIRGIAILSVLLTHTANVAKFDVYPHTIAGWPIRAVLGPGWAGVDLFFVLSGFLITGILLRTKRADNYLSSFYMRRILRIAPIYYLTIGLFFLVSRLSAQIRAIVPPIAPYLFYLQNWPIFLPQPPLELNIFGHFWSLAIEEQFYLVWPFVLLFLSETAMLWLCVIGFAAAIPLRLFLGYLYGFDFGHLMMLTSSRMDGLFVGAAISVFTWKYKRPVPMFWIIGAAVCGAAVFLAIVLRNPKELMYTGARMHTVGVSAVALMGGALVAASQHRNKKLTRVLNLSFLRTFGKYAYGLYVYHVAIYWIALRLTGVYPAHSRSRWPFCTACRWWPLPFWWRK